jgi:hypothetical protein
MSQAWSNDQVFIEMSTSQFPEAYQLKITLTDSEPEVWRRVQVSAQIALKELHDVVQRAMGWEDQHSYVFRLASVPCSPEQSLADILGAGEGQPLYYTYDFQSGWLHRIEVEALAEADMPAGTSLLPRCLEGESACPPENSGGVWGYDDFLARLDDSSAPDYMDLIEQYGDFDPYRFDLSAANRRLTP